MRKRLKEIQSNGQIVYKKNCDKNNWTKLVTPALFTKGANFPSQMLYNGLSQILLMVLTKTLVLDKLEELKAI